MRTPRSIQLARRNPPKRKPSNVLRVTTWHPIGPERVEEIRARFLAMNHVRPALMVAPPATRWQRIVRWLRP